MARKLGELARKLRVPAARAAARRLLPYFSAGIDSMGFVEVPGLGTLGVTEDGVLVADLDAMAGATVDEGATAVLHEWLHVYVEHPRRRRAMVGSGRLSSALDDKRLWNVAADFEVNCGLKEAGLKTTFAGGAFIFPKDAGLPDGLLAEEYVDLLRKSGPGKAFEVGSSEPAVGRGHCGSGGGVPVPGEPPPAPKEAEVSKAGGAGAAVASARAVVDAAVEARVEEKGQGSVPALIARQAKVRRRTPVLDWRQELARAARRAVNLVAGMDDYTFEMVSRWSGAFEGQDPMPVVPAMRQLVAEVAFVFDTSGSMGEKELSGLLGEAAQVLRALAGCRVTFVACDAAVHAVARVRTVKEMADGLRGGGGTDFRPAFDALRKFKPAPDVVVFGTDGFGTYPESPPPFRVVWLCVPGGKISVPWGRVVDCKNVTERPS